MKAESKEEAERMAKKRLNTENIALVHSYRMGSFLDFGLSTRFEREQEVEEARERPPEHTHIRKKRRAKKKEEENTAL